MSIDFSAIPVRELARGQRCEVWILRPRDGHRRRVLATTDILFEAPNWTSDGGSLILNGGGALWRLGLDDLRPVRIAFSGLPALNNDHVLDPDGEHVFVSANDGQLYRAPLAGGAATRVTTAAPAGLWHFLHGVDPAGERLAFIGLYPDGGGGMPRGDAYTMAASGDDYRQLTRGPGASDGAEYSPDGEWIYLNTEMFDGHAQIARMRVDGTEQEQLTFDDRVNWFPHPSPDGRQVVYLSYPPGTAGHPADLDVELRLVETGSWNAPRTVARLVGGQGTINVPSWSPDGQSFAYVAYPRDI